VDRNYWAGGAILAASHTDSMGWPSTNLQYDIDDRVKILAVLFCLADESRRVLVVTPVSDP